MPTKITSFGHFIPSKRIGNTELANRFEITEDWINERTGIQQRAYYEDGATSDMIVHAALDCLQQAKVDAKDIDCIIVATMTPDYYCPSSAAIVHQKLKTHNAAGFDIMAACSGYIYALQLADALIRSRTYDKILVCGADKMSSVINPVDRKTTLVLADGAGVSLLEYDPTENHIIDTLCRLDSTNAMDVSIKTGGSAAPLREDNIQNQNHYLQFNSKTIFQNGIALMKKIIVEILERNQLTFDDIDAIVPHQANKRMIEALAQELSLSIEKFIINVEHIGNTSAGTIPIALSQAVANRILKGNVKILLASLGAGFTYAASIINLNIK